MVSFAPMRLPRRTFNGAPAVWQSFKDRLSSFLLGVVISLPVLGLADLFHLIPPSWDSPFVWLPILGFGLLAACWLPGHARRKEEVESRMREGRCRRCGYDLRATRDYCPECGAAVGQGRRHATTTTMEISPDQYEDLTKRLLRFDGTVKCAWCTESERPVSWLAAKYDEFHGFLFGGEKEKARDAAAVIEFRHGRYCWTTYVPQQRYSPRCYLHHDDDMDPDRRIPWDESIQVVSLRTDAGHWLRVLPHSEMRGFRDAMAALRPPTGWRRFLSMGVYLGGKVDRKSDEAVMAILSSLGSQTIELQTPANTFTEFCQKAVREGGWRGPVQLVETDAALRQIAFGIVLVVAVWTPTCRVPCAARLRILSDLSVEGIPLIFVDSDSISPDLFIEVFGRVQEGYGETFWMRNGAPIATLWRPTSGERQIFEENTRKLLDAPG